MRFNLKNQDEKYKAERYFVQLSNSGSSIELKRINPSRSLPQNSYFHLLLSYVALEIGEEKDYFKEQILKRAIVPEIFQTTYTNPKSGEVRDAWKSSADLDSKEMTDVIEKLRNWSAKNLGLYLPEPSDISSLNKIRNEVDNNRGYI